MKKRVVAMLMSGALALSLAACGNGTAGNATTASSTAESETSVGNSSEGASSSEGARTIGINNWFVGSYQLDVLVNNGKIVTDIAGDSLQVSNDEGNAEKIITDLENMISSGVDGVLWMGMFENNFTVGPGELENAQKYFALYDKLPTDSDVRDQIQGMEYFAGGASNDNYEAGKIMAEQALGDGCKTVLIAGAEIGDPNTDARVEGFQTTFEEGGGQVLSTSRVTTGEANGPQQACDDMLAAYSDADAFYCTGRDFTLAALTVKANSGKDNLKVYGTDLDPDLLAYLKEGTLTGCCGAGWVTATYSAIMLENALDGHKMTTEDGKAPIIDDVKLIAVTSDQADLYEKFFINDHPYEDSEIEQLLVRNNPDVTVSDLQNLIDNYSFEERMKAKYDAGKVTKDELAAAGISVE